MSKLQQRLDSLTAFSDPDALQVHYPQEFRWKITRRQAIAVGILVLVLGCAWLVRHQDQPEWEATNAAIMPLETTSSSPTDTAAGDEEAAVVAVVGAVDQPGLYTLEATARIADALAVAGLHPTANTLSLNLAEKLSDGMQIYVPDMHEEPGELEPADSGGVHVNGVGPATGTQNAVSINNASLAELMSLPGVGEKTAQAIIDYRQNNGGFSSIEELQQVKGIGPNKFADLADLVSL